MKRQGGSTPNPLPHGFPQDPDALLRALARRMTEDDLREIAGADYGSEFDDHLEALRGIAAGEAPPSPLEWVPKEVLELTRWGEPAPGLPPERLARRHWQRAFACAVLLRASADPGTHLLGAHHHTLINLIASLRRLGGVQAPEAAANLAWLIGALGRAEPWERAFLGLGLLWFSLHPAMPTPDDAILRLADWIMLAEDAQAAEWRRDYGFQAGGGAWLLSQVPCDSCNSEWREFASWLAALPLEGRAGPVREAVRLLATALSG